MQTSHERHCSPRPPGCWTAESRHAGSCLASNGSCSSCLHTAEQLSRALILLSCCLPLAMACKVAPVFVPDSVVMTPAGFELIPKPRPAHRVLRSCLSDGPQEVLSSSPLAARMPNMRHAEMPEAPESTPRECGAASAAHKHRPAPCGCGGVRHGRGGHDWARRAWVALLVWRSCTHVGYLWVALLRADRLHVYICACMCGL